MPAQEKTEPPTPRRRGEARSRGQVARTGELTPAVMLLVAVWLLSNMAGDMGRRIGALAQQAFTSLDMADLTVSNLHTGSIGIALLIAQLIAPLIAAFVVVGIAGNVVQFGFLFTPKPLVPQLSRINPISGFKRLFSPNSLVELARTLAKVGIIGTVAAVIIFGRWEQLAAMADMTTPAAGYLIMATALEVAWKVAVGLFILAVLDFFYQRWRFERNLRMSREELKEEMKQVEGDPLVRSRLRQRQRALARQRMMQEVPRATVVVTNPVHVAVALQYKAEFPAPKVIAKGQRLIAEQLKRIAHQHSVPIIENKPLAQALFKTVEIGMYVPPDLFKAVAEVLALVYRLAPARAPGAYQASLGAALPGAGSPAPGTPLLGSVS